MTQISDTARNPAEKKLGPRLATMSQVTQEMRAIYREARAGQFEGGWAACGTAMRCLERLRFALAAGDLEARLDALEQHLNLRDARDSTARRHVEGYYDERPGALQ
jgi:hypothetical protein